MALHQQLLKDGYDSHMAVLQPQGNAPGVVKVGSKALRGINRGLGAVEKQLSWQSILPVMGYDLLRSPAYQQADILHFQVFYAEPYISLYALPRLCRGKKVVITLHDMWTFTGHCINAMDCDRWLVGCGHCPDLSTPLPLKRDTTHWLWQVKQDIFSSLDISLVAASQWMADRVRRSPILSQKPLYQIPFGVDTHTFHPQNRAARRQALGLPDGAFVIAFRSTLGGEDLKGTRYLVEALRRLDLGDNIWLVSFDRTGLPDDIKARYHVREMGWVGDPDQVAGIFAASDLFIIPSLADSFGLMALEALACGAVVVTFDGTAIPEVIHAPEGGLVVPARDVEALAQAVQRAYRDPALRGTLSQFGVDLVNREYTFDLYYRRHLNLYHQLLEN